MIRGHRRRERSVCGHDDPPAHGGRPGARRDSLRVWRQQRRQHRRGGRKHAAVPGGVLPARPLHLARARVARWCSFPPRTAVSSPLRRSVTATTPRSSCTRPGSTGLCGWVPYAAWAARHGIRAVVVDVCGFGRSQCSDELDADPAAQLALPVSWAREQGATSVTLVGASMGGRPGRGGRRRHRGGRPGRRVRAGRLGRCPLDRGRRAGRVGPAAADVRPRRLPCRLATGSGGDPRHERHLRGRPRRRPRLQHRHRRQPGRRADHQQGRRVLRWVRGGYAADR